MYFRLSAYLVYAITVICQLLKVASDETPLNPNIAIERAPRSHEPVIIVGGGLAGNSQH